MIAVNEYVLDIANIYNELDRVAVWYDKGLISRDEYISFCERIERFADAVHLRAYQYRMMVVE